MEKKYTVLTLKDYPYIESDMNWLHSIGWVDFMKENPISVKYWNNLLASFPEFQYVLFNEQNEPVACGNAIPFNWSGNEEDLPSGWDDVFEKRILDFQRKIPAN